MNNFCLTINGLQVTPGRLPALQGKLDADLLQFLEQWASDEETLPVLTSGSTGAPKRVNVAKKAMIASAEATLKALTIDPGKLMYLCMPVRYIAGKMMLVRAIVAHMEIVARPPVANPFAYSDLPDIHFVALTPMQMTCALQCRETAEKIMNSDKILLGGGPISPELERQIALFPHEVWSSYGMTETLSHIALRRLSGHHPEASYYPLPGVDLATDHRGALVITAPYLAQEPILTNDRVELLTDGSFVVLGRIDNVINSGGVKIQVEEIEDKLKCVLPIPLMLTSRPHPVLGEEVVLLLPQAEAAHIDTLRAIFATLPRYHAPRHILLVDELPFTATDKPARQRAKLLAAAPLAIIPV